MNTYIKEVNHQEFHLIQRLSDQEKVIYEGCSKEECHFQMLRYAEATEAANEERVELPDSFEDYDIIHLTNRPPYA